MVWGKLFINIHVLIIECKYYLNLLIITIYIYNNSSMVYSFVETNNIKQIKI